MKDSKKLKGKRHKKVEKQKKDSKFRSIIWLWFKRIILALPILILFILTILESIVTRLFKFIKKNIKKLLITLIFVILVIALVITSIYMNNIINQYNDYKEETNTIITDMNNTINEYKQELDTYKEEVNTKQEETNSRLDELDQKVTSRSASASVRKETSQVTQPTSELQEYAHNLVINEYGWSESDFTYLVKLWNRESNWNPNAHNSSSGAHGIPQSLPASKMASEGDDYYTNGETQIRWGLKYIAGRYGSPSNAWSHFQDKNWY
jgi:hypothetical protein